MKIFTQDGTELITITSVEPADNAIIIAGTIMGAMPMKGVLRAGELRSGRRFLSFRLIATALRMLVRG